RCTCATAAIRPARRTRWRAGLAGDPCSRLAPPAPRSADAAGRVGGAEGVARPPVAVAVGVAVRQVDDEVAGGGVAHDLVLAGGDGQVDADEVAAGGDVGDDVVAAARLHAGAEAGHRAALHADGP